MEKTVRVQLTVMITGSREASKDQRQVRSPWKCKRFLAVNVILQLCPTLIEKLKSTPQSSDVIRIEVTPPFMSTLTQTGHNTCSVRTSGGKQHSNEAKISLFWPWWEVGDESRVGIFLTRCCSLGHFLGGTARSLKKTKRKQQKPAMRPQQRVWGPAGVRSFPEINWE